MLGRRAALLEEGLLRALHTARAAPRLARTLSTKPYYITTPIFYVNAAPHIGHLHSDILADVLCRYQTVRTNGWSRHASPTYPPPTRPYFSTGTDEHGMKVQRVAESRGIAPRALCDQVSQRFEDLAYAIGLQHTRFIRTTDADHAEARTLVRNGHIYLGRHEGWYSVSDEAFYPETQIQQVEQDGETFHIATESGQRVEWTTEVNYKFRLSAFRERLIAWLEARPNAIVPYAVYDHVLSELRQGLGDLSVSRPRSRLHWGVTVPDDADHTIYVWVDALVNYLTAVGYPNTDTYSFQAWPADVHVVGKDIVRFHAIYWPALLMAADLPLPTTVLAHAHWTVEKAKMSKSRGNSVDPFEALATYGVDTLRAFLMRVGGNLGTDADYSATQVEAFQRKYLQGQLGNLLSRILAPKIQARLAASAQDEMLAAPQLSKDEAELWQTLVALPHVWDDCMTRYELAKAMQSAFHVIGLANEYVQRVAPWSAETDVDAVRRAVYAATETLRVVGILLQPMMPTAMTSLLDTLCVEERTWDACCIHRDAIPLRLAKFKIPPLFPRALSK
ncbi:Msm1p [Malassezia vespertilionis]|uniref:Probable methionine--tRNA ligase, mitochondrial n=1 Tax=Malassezia vespertilionis TaxID=2020962 RepID=A0A2N1J810_9BASI|nr:Msm1p [Malassezia vespertilionis]